jgi:acyl-CoA synthetase (AMP-forming)/AMP-acid ligase II
VDTYRGLIPRASAVQRGFSPHHGAMLTTAAGFEASSAPALLAHAAAHAGPSVYRLFEASACLYPDRLAVADKARRLSYRELGGRADRIAAALNAEGLASGDVIAILSENRTEFVEVELACARLGVVVACQNWRQSADELSHCLSLVEPKRLFVSPRFAAVVAGLSLTASVTIEFGTPFETWIHGASSAAVPQVDVDPESGLLILYTSGTTGMAKGAVISHRAMIARSQVMMAEWSIHKTDGSIAWSPLFHMAANDPMFCALMQGAPVLLVDGFDPNAICAALEEIPVGWMVLLPGMIDRMIEALKQNRTRVRRVAVAGCMANLVPPQQIADVTRLLGAPFLNSFGSTETGILPASGSQIAPGVLPVSFRKLPTGFADIRIVDDEDRPVEPGVIGEICLRSPTLFSGYWKAPDATANDFRNGWFHMGDAFVAYPDGSLDFIDRQKYLIKSGGENIYPAEIERLVLASDRVQEAVVVRQADSKWGEIPVLFIVRRDAALDEASVRAMIEGRLAAYKRPKKIIFAPASWIERNVTGKIRRDLLEHRLLEDPSLAGTS